MIYVQNLANIDILRIHKYKSFKIYKFNPKTDDIYFNYIKNAKIQVLIISYNLIRKFINLKQIY